MWEEYLNSTLDWLRTTGISILLVIAGALALVLAIRIVFKRIITTLRERSDQPERTKRMTTLAILLKKTLVVLVLTVCSLTVLSALGIDLAPVLTVVGIAGLAFSFGAQTVVKDFIAGILLLIENQVRVGDVVKVDDHSGVVDDLTLRTIKLRDINGNLHIVPNGSIASIVNMTKDYSRYLLEVSVAYKEDVDRVMQVIREVGEGLTADPEYADTFMNLSRCSAWRGSMNPPS